MKIIFAFVVIFAVMFAFAQGVEKPACLLPKEVGPCRKAAEAFFYNKDTQQCEEFIYGGCHGNENRFDSKADCEKQCKE